MLKNCFFVFFLAFFSSPLYNQTSSLVSDNSLLDQARLHLKRKQYDSASHYFERTLDSLVDIESTVDLSYVRAQLAQSLVSSHEFDQATNWSKLILDEPTSSLQARILTFQNLGAIANLKDRNDSLALKYNHQALSVSSEAYGRTAQESTWPFEQYRRSLQILAYFHRNKRSFDSAHYYFEKTIELTTHKTPFEAHLLVFDRLNLATLFLQQGEFEEAKNILTDMKEVIDQMPLETQEEYEVSTKYYNRLAAVYNRLGKMDLSLVVGLKEEALYTQIPYVDSVAFARALSNIGIAYYNLGHYTNAKAYEARALAIKKRVLDPDSYSLATSYTMVAAHLIKDSHSTDEAISYFKEALRIARKNWGDQSPQTSYAMQTLAYGYDTAEENEKALDLLLETLEVQLEVEGLYVLATAELYSQIAGTLRDLERYDESIANYKKYFEVSAKIPQADMRVSDLEAHLGLGKVYLNLEDYSRAKKHFETALKATLSTGGENGPVLAEIYNNMARIYRDQNRLAEAADLIEKAIAANSLEKSTFTQDTVPLNWLGIDQICFIESHLFNTQISLQRLTEESSQVIFDHAWDRFKTTEQLLEGWLSEQRNASDIIALQRYNNALYATAIKAFWKYDSLVQREPDAMRLWVLSEKSKAIYQKLKERKRQLSNMDRISIQIIEEETAINAEIDRYKSMILNGNEADSIQSKLFELTQGKKAFEARIAREFSKEYDLLYLGNDADTAQIMSRVGSKTIIDYFMSEDGLFAFLISAGGVKVHKLSAPNKLSDMIDSFNASLKEETNETYAASALALYHALVAPLEKDIKGSELIIVPHKDLWNVPFDLLLTALPSGSDFRTYDYLLRKYTISYAYSSSLLFNDKPNKSKKAGILAFAYDEDTADSSGLYNMRDAPKSNLPGTAREVRNLSKILKGEFYYGKEASESLFKELAPGHTVIHLAIHGEVNEEDPDRSKLYFRPGDQPSEEDNTLYTFELQHLNLQTNLVVLSACHTGAGQINSGEGIMSLGKAFQYAGVNSVLLSHWEVSDAVAPGIINDFYLHLKEGKDKAEALRLAKLTFLEEAHNLNASPFYWGSFFVLGDPAPVSFGHYNLRWLWLVGLLVIFVLFSGRKRFRAQQQAPDKNR